MTTLIVWDLGSGSSAIAAYEMGFDFTGYEIDADYFAAAKKRIERHMRQGRLFQETPLRQERLFQETPLRNDGSDPARVRRQALEEI